MITIHHIEGRRSERVAWLLEELGVPYELDFIQGDILGSLVALEQFHEMRMTPIVTDGDVVMVESSAILEYILARHAKGSKLRPAEDTAEFPRYLEFLHFAEGTAMSKTVADLTNQRLSNYMTKKGVEPPEAPTIPGVAGTRTGAQRVMHYAENTLGQHDYFAGDAFTAADIMMHFPLKFGAPVAAGKTFTIKSWETTDHEWFDDFPNVKDWMHRMAERPAFQRAMQATMPAGSPEH